MDAYVLLMLNDLVRVSMVFVRALKAWGMVMDNATDGHGDG